MVFIFIFYTDLFTVGYDFDANFSLYLGLNELSRLFEDHLYLTLFWTHFVAINLFVGGWMVKDSQKFSINKVLMSVPLIITYLTGPIGLFIYWIIRIFYAKKLNYMSDHIDFYFDIISPYAYIAYKKILKIKILI